MRYLPLFAFLFAAACGADGEPIQPVANLGLGIGPGGAHVGARIGVRQGPVAVTVGL